MPKILKLLRAHTSSLSTLILGDLILSNNLNAIYVLMTPNFLSPAQTSPLNSYVHRPTQYFYLDV